MSDCQPSNHIEVARKSGSNLAFTFARLSPAVKEDISLFYNFCKQVDDLADEIDEHIDNRLNGIERWLAIFQNETIPETLVEKRILELRERHQIPNIHFLEIIRGVEMDFRIDRYSTFEDLKLYCHRVASEVGIISARIFGAHHPGSEAYAINLGLGLQLTNILRDVGEDYREYRRIYLPTEEMEDFGYTEADLENCVVNDALEGLMNSMARRAHQFFERASAVLPSADHKNFQAARAMARIYRLLLKKMENDRFRKVFTHRYSIPKWRKALALVAW